MTGYNGFKNFTEYAQKDFGYDELIQVDFSNEMYNQEFPKNLVNDLIDILNSSSKQYGLTLNPEVQGFLDDFNTFLELYESSAYKNSLLGYEYSRTWSNSIKKVCSYF